MGEQKHPESFGEYVLMVDSVWQQSMEPAREMFQAMPFESDRVELAFDGLYDALLAAMCKSFIREHAKHE